MQPSISIITPSYNQGRFIRRTIDSVLDQQVAELEYIVVDGGSADETLDVLRSYGERVRWTSERDSGQAEAVNKGIQRTSGAIVGWLNSDDVYYPGALESVIRFFDDRPDVDVVYGDANHIDAEDRIIERTPAQPWSFQTFTNVCFISQPAAFVRRATIDRLGGLNASIRYSTDYDFWLRLALGGARFEYVPLLLAATRLHPTAATIARRVACHAEIVQLTRNNLGRAPDRWLLNYAHAVVDARPRLQSGRPLTTLTLAAVSLYAALRWNRAVSPRMLSTLARWIVADTTRPVRQYSRR